MSTEKTYVTIDIRDLNVQFDKVKLYDLLPIHVLKQYILANGWHLNIERNGTEIYGYTGDSFHVVVIHKADSDLPKYLLAKTFVDNIGSIVKANAISEFELVLKLMNMSSMTLGV